MARRINDRLATERDYMGFHSTVQGPVRELRLVCAVSRAFWSSGAGNMLSRLRQIPSLARREGRLFELKLLVAILPYSQCPPMRCSHVAELGVPMRRNL